LQGDRRIHGQRCGRRHHEEHCGGAWGWARRAATATRYQGANESGRDDERAACPTDLETHADPSLVEIPTVRLRELDGAHGLGLAKIRQGSANSGHGRSLPGDREADRVVPLSDPRKKMIGKSKLDELSFCGKDICGHIVLLCKSEIGIFFYSIYLAN